MLTYIIYMSALIIMDMQYDYCDGGPLAHNKSLLIIPQINRIRNDYDMVIFIKKRLQSNHSIFKYYGGTLPVHCVDGTNGEKLHGDLIINPTDIIIHRCSLQKYDSNSAFYDAESINKLTRLKQILQSNHITKLYFCGNGMDNSIFSTIIDAINFKYKCYILQDIVASIDPNKSDECIAYLQPLGITLL